MNGFFCRSFNSKRFLGEMGTLLIFLIEVFVLNTVDGQYGISGGSGWSGYFDGNNYLSINMHCQQSEDITYSYRANCKSIPSDILNSFTFQFQIYPEFPISTTTNVTMLSIENCLKIKLFVIDGIISNILLLNDAFTWNGNDNQIITSNINITNSTWNNIAITFHKNIGFNIYLNGNLSSFHPFSSYPSSLYNSSSLSSNFSIAQGFVGQIDELYFYDTALNQEKIEDNSINVYQHNDNNRIVIYFGFNDGIGNIVKDSTYNENNALIINYNPSSFWKISTLNLENEYTMNEDDQLVIPLYGYDVNNSYQDNDPSILITSLPDKGFLYQINIYQQITDKITTVPTIVTDTGNRVIFLPNYNEFGHNYTTFKYSISNNPINNETIIIHVLSVIDIVTPHIDPALGHKHNITIKAFEVDCDSPDTNLSVTIQTKTNDPILLHNETGITFSSNSTSNLSFTGHCSDVNNAIDQLIQIRSAYIHNDTDTMKISVSGRGKYYWGGELTTTKTIDYGVVFGIPPTVTNVEPTFITTNGQSYITIFGYDFLYENYSCIFTHNVK